MPDVKKLLRAWVDPAMKELGFRWARMLGSSDGWYVRTWDGGRDTFGWGVASYSPQYSVGAFATVRLDAVEELVTPHIPFSPPEAAREAWTCNVTDLLAFVEGPTLRAGQTMARAKRTVQREDEVQALAQWYAALARDRIDPWWRSMRTPEALWHADSSWRKFWASPLPLREVAFAFLCEPRAEQERLENEWLRSFEAAPPHMHRGWFESLLTDLRARRR